MNKTSTCKELVTWIFLATSIDLPFCPLNTCLIKCSFSTPWQFLSGLLLLIQLTFFTHHGDSGWEMQLASHCDSWQPQVTSIFFFFHFRIAYLGAFFRSLRHLFNHLRSLRHIFSHPRSLRHFLDHLRSLRHIFYHLKSLRNLSNHLRPI